MNVESRESAVCVVRGEPRECRAMTDIREAPERWARPERQARTDIQDRTERRAKTSNRSYRARDHVDQREKVVSPERPVNLETRAPSANLDQPGRMAHLASKELVVAPERKAQLGKVDRLDPMLHTAPAQTENLRRKSSRQRHREPELLRTSILPAWEDTPEEPDMLSRTMDARWQRGGRSRSPGCISCAII